ncbi:MAG: Holliday junction resolvase Hjc [Candidatus ainarchaeum sp.]|nr:Holliday junction resolvase Hjc [Candidatus ainarchaeum sp.]
MGATYRKGSRAERELINFFYSKGFSVIRAAGSGVSSLSPDILVFRKGKNYAIESKAWETEYLHIKKDQFLGLRGWEENTGITCYIAWRRSREPWYFIPLSVFEENKASFAFPWEKAKLIGRKLEDLI